MTKTQIAIRQAAKRYVITYPFVQHVSNKRPPFKPRANKQGYPVISVRCRAHGICMNVTVHQVLAYQRYGEKIFEEGTVCRHLNGVSADFSDHNIAIGTQRDNILDIPVDVRIRRAERGGRSRRVLTDEQIIAIRADKMAGMSYSALVEKYDLSSKGTAHYIVNHFGRRNQ